MVWKCDSSKTSIDGDKIFKAFRSGRARSFLLKAFVFRFEQNATLKYLLTLKMLIEGQN